MVNTLHSAAANDRLNSWKDIAAYLERDVRTVIRWEEKGLPVYRVPGGKRQAIFAYRAEIDDWMHGRSVPPPLVDRDNSTHAVPDPAAGTGTTFSLVTLLEQRKLAVAIVSTVLVTFLTAILFLRLTETVQVTKVTRLSRDAFLKSQLATDGTNVYFDEYADGKVQLSRMSTRGGSISHIPTPFSQAILQDISADGREILVRGTDGREQESGLWIVPVDGRPPRKLGSIVCGSAARSPDGKAIAYAAGNRILITVDEGATSRELSHFDSEPAAMTWTRSGDSLRFILQNSTSTNFNAWRIEMDASFNVLSISHDASKPEGCCLHWVDSHQQEFFARKGNGGQIQMWAIPQRRHWWTRAVAQRIDLPPPLTSLSALAADPHTYRLLAIGEEPSRGELVRFEPFSRTFSPFLPGISAVDPDISSDGKWVTYVDIEREVLWVSRTDGGGRKQVKFSFEGVQLPKWSPDGHLIAFMAKIAGRPWRIYVVSSEGGTPREVSTGSENQGAPTWSPDGKSLVYANVLCQSRHDCAVHRAELSTGKIETIRGSEGLRTARWSPDGRYIAALQAERHQLLLFDFKNQSWAKLSDSITGDDLAWSRDSRYIYSNRPVGDDPGIVRIPATGGAAERVVDLKDLTRQTGRYDAGLCVGPDNSVILLREVNSSEIYALDWTVR